MNKQKDKELYIPFDINKWIDEINSMSWYENMYYSILRFIDCWISPKTWWYRIKRFWVFISRGFDPKDTWSLDYSIARYVLPRLRYFKEKNTGRPCCFVVTKKLLKEIGLKIPEGVSIEEINLNKDYKYDDFLFTCWDKTIDRMIESFELFLNQDDIDISNSKERLKQMQINYERIQKGLYLFAEYYQALWW
ncbi:MAG: hypothetical protein ACOCZ5_01355 [bacterium]